jgi:hypothetical protein
MGLVPMTLLHMTLLASFVLAALPVSGALDATTCRNSGIQVILGNHECDGGTCWNSGVVIWMGQSCLTEGNMVIGLCVASRCEGVPKHEHDGTKYHSSPLLP